jgi:hypothetical protein
LRERHEVLIWKYVSPVRSAGRAPTRALGLLESPRRYLMSAREGCERLLAAAPRLRRERRAAFELFSAAARSPTL